jgi:DnaJ-class molecular chaperone
VGLLRGAGNAIVPQTAEAFIRAYMDIRFSGDSRTMENQPMAVCPKCRGKKFIAVDYGFFRGAVRCHVCHGEGVVPHEPLDKEEKKRRDEARKRFAEKAQMKLF